MSSRVLTGVERPPALLSGALALSGLAAALLAVGSVSPVVQGGEPAFGSAPLLIALALLPFVVALAGAVRGRSSASAGVLVGAAALAPGRVVLDLQFIADASVASRPELYLATDLGSPDPVTGLWLLIGGHVATGAAGLLGARVPRQPTSPESTDGWRQRWLLVVVVASVVAAIGVLMAPVTSDDVYLLARNAFEGPLVALVGYLLIACALPLAAALLMTSSGDGAFARGGLAGVALAVLSVAGPGLAAGVGAAVAGISAGPIIALVGVAGLLAVAGTKPAREPAPDDAPDSGSDGDEAGEAIVPGRRRLQTVTGVLAVATAAMAVAGAWAAQLSTPGDAPAPESPARWSLFTAGVLVGLLGLAMFIPRLAPMARPVLSVAWAGVLVAGAAVLDTAIAASSLPGAVSTGPGVLWTWLAMVVAVATACSSVVTGFVERDDTEDLGAPGVAGGDDSAAEPARPGVNLLALFGVAAVLAIVAFGRPVITAPGYVAPGLWSNFGTPSWGLLAGLLTVLGAALLAVRSRPVPAAGLLAGASCVLGLHAAALPLTGPRIDGATAGTGLWFALAAVVALLLAAGVALAGRRDRGLPKAG